MALKKIAFGLLVLASALLFSCSKEAVPGGEPEPGPTGTGTITAAFALDIPGNSTPVTRSMAGAKESEVREIDLLVFKADPAGNQTLEYVKKGADIINTVLDGNYKAWFRATLTEGERYNVLIVANAAERIQQLLNENLISIGDSKISVLENLEITAPDGWGDPSGTGGSYIPVPMCGETGVTAINVGQTLSPVAMVRMLARIDVKIYAPNFELTNIWLCNPNFTGRIAPYWDPASGDLLPGVPAAPNIGTPGTRIGEAVAYSASQSEGYIYVCEAPAADDAFPMTREKEVTYLILQGIYEGEEYYYRVDFTSDGSGSGGNPDAYMPVLRNHLYIVEVTAVEGVGYRSPGEARASQTVQSVLHTKILSWNQSEIKEIVFNQQYMMGLSRSTVNLRNKTYTGPDTDNQVIVTTNYTLGWEVDRIADIDGNRLESTWLRSEGQYSAANAKDILSVIAQFNDTGTPRTGYIYLKAGRLRQKITVTQDANI